MNRANAMSEDDMQRYSITEDQDATPATRDVYDDFMRATGDTQVPLWLKTLGHSPALARAYWERAKGTLLRGSLPLPLKEMIVFAVSAKNGARYCSACHARCVLSLDTSLSFDDLQAMIASGTSDKFPAYYRSVVRFALKATADANSLTDADFEQLAGEGFTLQEIGEIIAVIDLATMFNVYTSALRIDLDPEYRAIL